MRVLVLGVKEFPIGTSTDPIPSGGIEYYWSRELPYWVRDNDVTIVTRRFENVPREDFCHNAKIVRVPWIQGRLFRTATFSLFSAVWLLLHKHNCDLVVANGPWSGFFAGITKLVHHRKVLFIPHGVAHTQPNYPRWSRSFHRFVEKVAYLMADSVLFFTEGEAKHYRSVLHVPPASNTVIRLPHVSVPPVSEEDKQRMREELGVSGKKVIMFVGRLVKVKGVDILLRAFAQLDRPDAVLVIVGDGPERQNLERLARELNVFDRIIFTGWRDDASKLVSIADVFVLPSLSEGLPQALLEALAHGVPCVVSDIPPLRGLPVQLFKVGDSADLTTALKRTLG